MSNFSAEFIKFIHMGGYAGYVWPAYLLAFIVLILNIYFPMRKQHRLLKKLAHERLMKEGNLS